MKQPHTDEMSNRRRAASAIMVVVTLPVIIGFGALAVDVGVLYGTRADLQDAADAAALAGASALTGPEMIQVRMETAEFTSVRYQVNEKVYSIAYLNESFGRRQTTVVPEDIAVGWIDLYSATSPLQTGIPPASSNAVQVIVRRTEGSPNGPVELMFAPIFGKHFSNVSASAVAAFDDRVSGYDTSAPGGGALPLTMYVDNHTRQLTEGGDEYAYDPSTESVSPGRDSTREVNVYPGDQAPGNFGLLNIGTPNLGLPALVNQIENGVPPEDFERETGSAELTFYGDEGSVTYDITGNAGLKSSLEKALLTRVGQVVSYFVHDKVDDTGSNAVYRIVGIRFGRVMQARLQAADADRGLWIQPVVYTGAGVRTSRNAPSSGGVAGRIVLAR